jgi:hypothetical protein
MPLRAGQLRRYTGAIRHLFRVRLVFERCQRLQRLGRSVFGPAGLWKAEDRSRVGRSGFTQAVADAVPSIGSSAVGLQAAGFAQPQAARLFLGSWSERCRQLLPVRAVRFSSTLARHNRSIDTDVLAAGFAHLWPAGHFRR